MTMTECKECGVPAAPEDGTHLQACKYHDPFTCAACTSLADRCDCGAPFHKAHPEGHDLKTKALN